VTDAAETPPDVVGPRDHLHITGQSTPACTHPAHFADAASAPGGSRASLVQMSIPVVLTCPTGTTHARDETAWLDLRRTR
jgi:hypothetical protein